MSEVMEQASESYMMWHDTVYDTAICKVAGTPDAVNLNKAEIKIRKRMATHLLGFYVGYNLTEPTDAEILPDLIIRITSEIHGIVNRDRVIPKGSNDADANNPYSAVKTAFVPFELDSGKELFNSTFSFQALSSASPTAGLDVFICAVYANGPPSAQLLLEIFTQTAVGFGTYKANAAKAHATANSPVSLTTMVLPASSRVLRGILAKAIPNAITEKDPLSGVVELSSVDIDDFGPQILPFCIMWNAALGTVAEGAQQCPDGYYYPIRFPLSGAGADVKCTSTVMVVQGTAPDINTGLLYDLK